MINQVVTANNAPKNAFKDFSQPKNGYYLNAPFVEEEKKKKTDLFCEDNLIYRKFTDQDDVSIDEVVKRFKQDN